MRIRTLYWTPPQLGLSRRLHRRLGSRRRVWIHGNAGDIYNSNLLDTLYARPHVVAQEGPRLLLVGSIAHRVQAGDVVCGVGTKGSRIPSPPPVDCEILAVRGPITYAAFKDAGYDVSRVRFQYDPGLLIASMLPEELGTEPTPGRTIFIPHYRDDPAVWRHVPSVELVSIDANPLDLARDILRAELVYSSSLHGVIFAHALGRPCVPVAPASAEPLLKYFDYLESVSLHVDRLPTLSDAIRDPKPVSPIDMSWRGFELSFPTLDDLAARKIYA